MLYGTILQWRTSAVGGILQFYKVQIMSDSPDEKIQKGHIMHKLKNVKGHFNKGFVFVFLNHIWSPGDTTLSTGFWF